MNSIKGGCACGNIQYQAELSKAPTEYHPRACDCDFCTKHAAAYISDPNGKLYIQIKQPEAVSYYQQGTKLAEFMICKYCGILSNVLWRSPQGLVFGSINSRSVEQTVFAEAQAVSLTAAKPEESIARWESLWFKQVEIETTKHT